MSVLNDLFNSKTGELVLKIDDKNIAVHKVILQKESNYFKKIFDSNMQESNKKELVIDSNYETFLIFIKLFYGFDLKFPMKSEILFELLGLCDYYDCPNFFCLVEKKIIDGLNPRTFVSIANLCCNYKFANKIKKEVLNKVDKFIENYKKVILPARVDQIKNKCYDLNIDMDKEEIFSCCLHSKNDPPTAVNYKRKRCCINQDENSIKINNHYTKLCCKHRVKISRRTNDVHERFLINKVFIEHFNKTCEGLNETFLLKIIKFILNK